MKCALIPFLLILTLKFSVAQSATGRDDIQVVGHNKSGSLQAFSFDGGYAFKFRNGHRLDTLTFTDVAGGMDSCRFGIIRHDLPGPKVILISWTSKGASDATSASDVACYYAGTTNEVWDLRHRKMLFEANSSDYYKDIRTLKHVNAANKDVRDTIITTNTFTGYNFSLPGNGTITITNLPSCYTITTEVRRNGNVISTTTEDRTGTSKFTRQDHEPGVYIFKNGSYHKREEKK